MYGIVNPMSHLRKKSSSATEMTNALPIRRIAIITALASATACVPPSPMMHHFRYHAQPNCSGRIQMAKTAKPTRRPGRREDFRRETEDFRGLET